MQDRLEQAAARVEIMDVLNRYAAAIDTGDWQRLRSCFTPDATVHFGTRVLDGPDAIVAFIAGVRDAMSWQQHLIGSHQVTVEDGRATSTCALHATQIANDPNEPMLTTMGTYHDVLVRTDGGWKIFQRELRVGFRRSG